MTNALSASIFKNMAEGKQATSTPKSVELGSRRPSEEPKKAGDASKSTKSVQTAALQNTSSGRTSTKSYLQPEFLKNFDHYETSTRWEPDMRPRPTRKVVERPNTRPRPTGKKRAQAYPQAVPEKNAAK